MRRSFLALSLAISTLLIAALPAAAEDRIALVIGNNRYPNLAADKQLSKAVNDARAVGTALEQIGFKVIRGENLDRQGMIDRVFSFTQQIKQGDIALLFYAGHGVAISGGNYLLPSDVRPAAPGEESRVRNMAIGEADIVADIQEKKARVAVLLLDACRDNPFRQPGLLRTAGSDAGLTRGREGEGVFAVYSAGFGQSALDSLGPGDSSSNSVFTRVLVPALARTDAHLGDMVVDMREEVAKLASTVNHQQFPAYYDQTRGGRVYLAARTPGATSAPQVRPPPPPVVAAAPPPPIIAPSPPPLPSPPQQVAALPTNREADLTRPDARGYPSKPISIIVPFPAGGSSDMLARTLAGNLSQSLGQPVIIENVAGAGGTIGVVRAAKAAPDGHTLVLGSVQTHATAPTLYAKLDYSPERDFAPVALVATTPFAILAAKDLPARNLAEFVAYAKANSSKLTFGSNGMGTMAHASCVYLGSLLGIQPTHVPYRGSGPMIQDLAAGHIQFACDQTSSAIPLINAGTIKALAVAAPDRSAALPNVPTTAEAGLPAFQAEAWSAIFAPKATPAPIVAKLNAAVFKALADPAVRNSLVQMGMHIPKPDRTTQAALSELVKTDIAKWKPFLEPLN